MQKRAKLGVSWTVGRSCQLQFRRDCLFVRSWGWSSKRNELQIGRSEIVERKVGRVQNQMPVTGTIMAESVTIALKDNDTPFPYTMAAE